MWFKTIRLTIIRGLLCICCSENTRIILQKKKKTLTESPSNESLSRAYTPPKIEEEIHEYYQH